MVEVHSPEAEARWLAGIDAVFGTAPVSRNIVGSPQTILRVLEPFLGPGIGHANFSSSGGVDILDGRLGDEGGTIDLIAGERFAYLVKPARLGFHYVAAAPGESFLYLELAGMQPTDLYGPISGDSEEVVDLGSARYLNRSIWDHGVLRHDEDGNEVPLPAHARVLVRVMRGSILFVRHGSIWNRVGGTYDGQLQRVGEAAIFDAITGAVR